MKITFFAGLRHRLFNMLPYLAVSLLIWAVCVLSSFGGERETFFSVFTEAVGGVEHSGQFDLFGFFRLFRNIFAGLFLGMAGSVLDSETMPYFILPRSKSFSMVDKNRFVRASLVCALLPYRHSRLRSGGGKSRNAFHLWAYAHGGISARARCGNVRAVPSALSSRAEACGGDCHRGCRHNGAHMREAEKLQLRHARRIRHGKTADRCKNGCGGTLCRRDGNNPCLFMLRRSEEKGFERRTLF